MVFTNYSKSQKFEIKSCLLVFEESSIGTLLEVSSGFDTEAIIVPMGELFKNEDSKSGTS